MHVADVLPPSDAVSWLSSSAAAHGQAGTEAAHTRAALLGRLAFLSAWLDRADMLPPSPADHRGALAEPCERLPRQTHCIAADTTEHAWLQAAALAEFLGEGALGRLLVDGVARHVHHDPELLALCECRRGRIARLAGRLDDAALHYRAAIRRTAHRPARDAWPLAMSGLSNVHIDQGNFPAAERRLRALLNPARGVLAAHRVNGWLGLALVRRKRQDPLDAMLCAWNAFDLVPADRPERIDLLVTLAEAAMDCGDGRAATNGFRQAWSGAPSDRLRAAASTGLVRCVVRTLAQAPSSAHITELHDAVALLDSVLLANLAPQERTLALLVRVEAGLATLRLPDSATNNDTLRLQAWLTEAQALAAAHDYHEYVFRGEELAAALAREERDEGALHAAFPVQEHGTEAARRRHVALRRLLEYAHG
jgi:hypothetical protein